MGLKGPYPGHIQLIQRPAADATDNNGINVMPAKPSHRITGTMLMNLIAVAD